MEDGVKVTLPRTTSKGAVWWWFNTVSKWGINTGLGCSIGLLCLINDSREFAFPLACAVSLAAIAHYACSMHQELFSSFKLRSNSHAVQFTSLIQQTLDVYRYGVSRRLPMRRNHACSGCTEFSTVLKMFIFNITHPSSTKTFSKSKQLHFSM
jgi:hypothetical protein